MCCATTQKTAAQPGRAVGLSAAQSDVDRDRVQSSQAIEGAREQPTSSNTSLRTWPTLGHFGMLCADTPAVFRAAVAASFASVRSVIARKSTPARGGVHRRSGRLFAIPELGHEKGSTTRRRGARLQRPRSGHQSRKGRENIPVAGTNRERGEII
eukprot:1185792-Prorocentrum_minimum.AAC.2